MFTQNLQHCFIEQINSNDPFIVLDKTYYHHFIKVLRLKIGDQLSLTNGQGLQIYGKIFDIDFKQAIFKLSLHEPKQHGYSLPKITVGIPLLKQGSRLEFMIEKLVELGVFKVFPLICEHTGFYKYNWQRLENIVLSSIEQSIQFYKPVFHDPILFNDFLKLNLPKNRFIAHCAETPKQSINTLEIASEAVFIFGPEGDFSNQEITQALQNQFMSVSLGTNRLRSETAVIACVAAYKYRFNNNKL
ncbi:MAG: RsmE family RNA methyltransferase [Alphaproteobacteria bacterium]|nr:RsmE family RNA methyltransferase [Alphaproteobacteria bacterium]